MATIPPQEELDAAARACAEMKPLLQHIRDLIRVAREHGTHCNGVFIPLPDELVEPLIDKYLTHKAQMVALFQELP